MAKLSSSENNCCSRFFAVQSEVNAFFKVVTVSVTKSVSFNISDELVVCLKFGIRSGISDVFLIPNESC
mgnify:FL=1